MTTTAAEPKQTVAACRWARPGYRVEGVPEQLQPETEWICVRGSARRCVSDDDCQDCIGWQPRKA